MVHKAWCRAPHMKKILRQKLENNEITVEQWIDLAQEALLLCKCPKTSDMIDDGGGYVNRDGYPITRFGIADTWEGFKPHEENKCKWRKVGIYWHCEHDAVLARHPNGYCDQGCCR